MTAKHKLSDEEREKHRAQDRERLKLAAEQLLTNEGWQRWVAVRSRAGLARLSLVIWGTPCRGRFGAVDRVLVTCRRCASGRATRSWGQRR